MKIQLPKNIRELQPYVAGKTIAAVQKAYQPPRISKLASNENRLGYSPAVKPAVLSALKEIQNYPDPAARRLRAALAQKNNVGLENVIVAAGSESIIANLCRTFFQNDEEALTANATFVGFFVQAQIRGVDVATVPVTNDYRFNIPAMIDAITARTKMIYIANPNNPTGTYINQDEFENLMKRVPNDVLVIMDEAYYEFAEDKPDYPKAATYEFENVISLRTFSKAYGLAGMRVGYAVAPQALIGPMLKTKLTFEPTALAQEAALAALGDQEFIAQSKEVVRKGRNRLYQFLDEQDVAYVRSVSNSVLMICDSIKQAQRFNQAMLEEGVILRRTNAFGLPNCIRLTIGTKSEMDHFESTFLKIKSNKELTN